MRWKVMFLMALILTASVAVGEVKLIKLNHRSATEIKRCIEENFPTLTARGVLMVDLKSNSILLRVREPFVGEPSLSELEEMIKALDIPISPKEVEVILRLVIASKKEEQGETPEGISELISALQPIFKFRSYRLVFTSVLRCEEGSSASIKSAGYFISFRPMVSEDRIRLEDFRVSTSPFTPFERVSVSKITQASKIPSDEGKKRGVLLQGTISVKDGKTRVMGGISLDEGEVLMVVITARRIKEEVKQR
ncbi:MAG: hypothetical protein DRJ31_08335 [Candidatus Methanomethylicota archaeon]|uniref:NolW-like domain-containing protein n=1 Tax=Thermoproteota archaeon TaxID=2056631 RepID=A0A497ELN7_9CREN|nr:MAG: hypothetical protein DRJ31_08335 [Candidatus Verstraetearchaeota archaeon]